MRIKTTDFEPYIAWICDDALSARDWKPTDELQAGDVVLAWQCGFEPLAIVVRSYLPETYLDADEAIELATDWLCERNWFAGPTREPDYVMCHGMELTC